MVSLWNYFRLRRASFDKLRMIGFLLRINEFLLRMNGFLLRMNGFLLRMNGLLLRMNGLLLRINGCPWNQDERIHIQDEVTLQSS